MLSELMRGKPAASVLDWFAQNTHEAMHTSTVTQAEILTGIAMLPAGKRRNALAIAAGHMFEQDFAGHCLAFDTAAAKNYVLIVAKRTGQGQPISAEDAQIAVIALAGALTVATRNTPGFENIDGLTLVNPWQALPRQTP